MNLPQRISLLEKLGIYMRSQDTDWLDAQKRASLENGWFVPPFIENAIWHGIMKIEGEKKIEISIREDEGDVLCIIQDNGIGREASTKFNLNKRYKSFATDANLNRLELLNQNFKNKIRSEIIDLKDEQGNSAGTKVKLIIPIKPV